MPVTVTGRFESVVVPLPSWPERLLPQQRTVPDERRTQVVCAPAVMPTTALAFATVTGSDELVLFPLPSWPRKLKPQHWTPPVESTAQVWEPPVAIATTVPAKPTTETGTSELVVVPLPSWPLVLVPQHERRPFVSSAQV